MNFADLLRYDKNRLVNGLDLTAVARALGCDVNEYGDKMRCPDPSHEDNDPSCNIFTGDDGKQRWKCQSCGERGDVIDLVMVVECVSYSDALTRCAELLDEGLPAPPVREKQAPVDLNRILANARRVTDHDDYILLRFLADRQEPYDVKWLRENFDVQVDDMGTILVPHFEAGEREPHAIKRRRGDDKFGYRDQRLTSLYGEWRDKGRKTVVVVEGESDTWRTAWLLRDAQVDVLGLPRGVGSSIDDAWLDRLRGRDVILLFDADDAGRKGLKRWCNALISVAESIRIAHLPESNDACSVPTEALEGALREATLVVSPAGLPVQKANGRYMKQPSAQAANNGAVALPITDWALDVLRRIEIPGTRVAFDVRLPNGRTALITDKDFTDTRTITRWANPLGLTYEGRGTDVQNIYRLLEIEALFVPRLTGVEVAGWHDGSLVFPEGVVGNEAFAWIAPEVGDASAVMHVNLDGGSVDRAVADTLARLHTSAVMTPIVGWTAAAPLRAICAQFPTLAVMGSAGSGKTTLVSEVLRTFGFSDGTPITISHTTSHGVWSSVAYSNALPVWFDEYRYGAREDGMRALDQAIRDGWNGSATLRGGIGDNKAAVHAMISRAPIVVSGESAFTEQSHAERMAVITLNRHERNPDALAALKASRRDGFGRAYLNWLVASYAADTLPAPPALDDRPEQVVAVCEWGYGLFRQFAREVYGIKGLPEFDDTGLRSEQQSMGRTPPVIEAIREFWMAEDKVMGAGSYIAWADGQDVLVKVGRLPSLVAKHSTIVLPGNATACRKWLEEAYPGASTVRLTDGSTALRLPNAYPSIMV